MNQLRELQEKMQAFVLAEDKRVFDAIVKPANMDVEERLLVYRNGYYLRLIDILQDDYSVLCQVMGEKAFAAMIRSYLRTFPSHHFSVNSVGKHLASFLKNTDGCHRSFVELAKFEWTLGQALTAPDVPMFTMADLAAVPPESWPEMVLNLHPSVNIISCQYNTLARWQHNNENGDDIDAVLLDEPQFHMLWRYDNSAHFCTVSQEQRHLLQLFQQGKCFALACETMFDYFSEDEVVHWVAGTLQEWVEQEVFCLLS